MAKRDEDRRDALLAEVVLHLRDPNHFGCRRLTHEEIADLLGSGKDPLSRMTYCNDEKSALLKLRNRLTRMGITSACDVLDFAGGAPATAFGSVDPDA